MEFESKVNDQVVQVFTILLKRADISVDYTKRVCQFVSHRVKLMVIIIFEIRFKTMVFVE